MLDKEDQLAISIPVHPKVVRMGCGQGSVWANQDFFSDPFSHVFMDLVLCTGAQSCYK